MDIKRLIIGMNMSNLVFKLQFTSFYLKEETKKEAEICGNKTQINSTPSPDTLHHCWIQLQIKHQ